MNKYNKLAIKLKLRFPEFINDGEWKEITLGNIGVFTGGGTPSKNHEYFWKGDIPWISSSDLDEESIFKITITRFISDEALEESSTKKVPPNSILIVSRVGVGKVAISKESVCTSQDFTSITPKDDDIIFIAYLIKSKKKNILALCQGMAIKGFTKESLENLIIHKPKIKEQQKIAACLSSLDDVITAETQKLETLQVHKKGLLQNLFPNDSETIPNFRFEEFQDSNEWTEDTLLRISSFRRGSFPQPYGLPEWYDDETGMPFIQVFDVGEDFRLKPTTKNKISKLASNQSVFIPKGTLIITLQGSIGRVAITQYDAYIDRTLLLFEEFHKEIDLTFFAYTIFLLFEIEKQKAPGGIIKTITKEVLSSFVVKVPPIKEQKKIASCLSSLDEFISAQSIKIESLNLHKKGLLQGLFPNITEINT